MYVSVELVASVVCGLRVHFADADDPRFVVGVCVCVDSGKFLKRFHGVEMLLRV